jgi:hypothetical protein
LLLSAFNYSYSHESNNKMLKYINILLNNVSEINNCEITTVHIIYRQIMIYTITIMKRY